MQSLFNFIVKPKNKRYNNTKQIGDSELLLNSEISDHRYVSRNGIVLGLPKAEKTNIKIGDEVIVHHNVFRRFYDIRGNEKNSKSYFKDNLYFVQLDQIYLYKRSDKWKAFGDRHGPAVKKNCEEGDLRCRRRQRQALLQWAYNPIF